MVAMLPIVRRELRAAALRGRLQRLRFIAVLCVMLAAGAVLIGAPRHSTPQETGGMLLIILSTATLIFCLYVGVIITADSISGEKRDGTLGLLFLTRLKAHDVLLGKLASASLQTISAVVSILPIFALPLLLGGVTFSEVARVVVSLLLALLLSLSVGMLISALCRDGRASLISGMGVVTAITFLPQAIWWLAEGFWPGKHRAVDLLLLSSPVYGYSRAFSNYFDKLGGSAEFWMTQTIIFTFSLVALIAAARLTSRAWHEHGHVAQKWLTILARRYRTSIGQRHPYYWLCNRNIAARTVAWAALGFAAIIWCGFFSAPFARPGHEESIAGILLSAYAAHLIFKLLATIEATRRFSEDWHSGALELLAVTPLTSDDLVRTQRTALRRRFKPLKWLVLLMNAAVLCQLLGPNPTGIDGKERGMVVLGVIVGMVLAVTDFDALVWTGMAEAVRARSHQRAFVRTFVRVIVAPIAGMLIFALAVATSSEDGMFILLVCWLAVGIAVDAAVISKARRVLADVRGTLVRAHYADSSPPRLFGLRLQHVCAQ